MSETRDFRVSFRRIGDNFAVPALTVCGVVDPAHLAQEIADYARPYVPLVPDAPHVSVWLDMRGMQGHVCVGFKDLGDFAFLELGRVAGARPGDPVPVVIRSEVSS